MAAVHYLLLAGTDSPLADLYPTVATWRRDGPGGRGRALLTPPSSHRPSREGWYSEFAGFCRTHRDLIEDLLATRSTQTNEIGRCSGLLLALGTIARHCSVPLSVIDLGASAGLNLLFDRYSYTYSVEGGAECRLIHAGDPTSAVRLQAGFRSRSPLVPELPEVSWRAGIDLTPVNPADEDDALWLLACQWPEHLDRFIRLDAALALSRTIPDRKVVAGDLVADLGSIVSEAPADTHLCIMHTWVAAYLSEERQRQLAEQVAKIAASRSLSWLYAEEPYESPGLPTPPSPDPRPEEAKGATAVVLTEYTRGHSVGPWRIADMHPHGRWVHWWGRPV